jgi:hypothetical protein
LTLLAAHSGDSDAHAHVPTVLPIPVFHLRIGDLGSTAAKEFVGPSIPQRPQAAYGQGAIEGM